MQSKDPELQRHARVMRREMTPAERMLWRLLRNDALGCRFRRQHPIPPYVADFACVSARLVIEIDGWTHADPTADVVRDAALKAEGWRVLRFWNNEVMANPEGVVQAIQAALVEYLPPHPDPPAEQGRERVTPPGNS